MENEIVCPVCNVNKSNLYLKKNGYSLYKCFFCKLVFVFPLPNDLQGIYDEEYFFSNNADGEFGYVNYDRDKESTKEFFTRHLDKFESYGKNKKIFDIGAATGFFLDLARSKGWIVSGSEISEFAANKAKNRGLDVYKGNLLDYSCDNKFDVVTMWDVFEHIEDPAKYLEKINKMLDKDGLLSINTVDISSLYAYIRGKKWHMLIPPEHIYYFSKKNLKILLEKHGFEVLEFSKPGKKFSLSYIFYILYQTQNFKMGKILSKWFDTDFWRKFAIPINLRDNIFVIAKKIKDI